MRGNTLQGSVLLPAMCDVSILIHSYHKYLLLFLPHATLYSYDLESSICFGYLLYQASQVFKQDSLKEFPFPLQIISAITGGITDLSFNATGYAWQTLNCFLTASYSVSINVLCF
jgi:hypothetical protein